MVLGGAKTGERGRQMADSETTTTKADWRQAWRSFAAALRPNVEGNQKQTPVAVGVESDETRGETFQGFRSPPGKF